MTSPRAQHGFTAVELLVVIAIMMILLGIAVPTVMPAIRRGKVNSGLNDIVSCWRQARTLAIMTPIPPGATPSYFGIVIKQVSGAPSAGLIFDNIATGTPKYYMQGQDPLDASTYSASGTPATLFNLGKTVTLCSTPAGGGAESTADNTIIIYAQYGTGLPLAPADVAANHGTTAAPTSLGVTVADPSFPAVPSICPVVRLQTFDFDPAPATRRGYATSFAIYHAGFTTAQEF
jgi:prepilin-type N-terminal cleavage/methylation domain-containing protein